MTAIHRSKNAWTSAAVDVGVRLGALVAEPGLVVATPEERGQERSVRG